MAANQHATFAKKQVACPRIDVEEEKKWHF